jgi:hypothetical protein
MPSTPAEIHEVADRLWQGSQIDKRNEACVRTVAGRSYYAAYTSTRDALRAAYGDPTYDVAHETLFKFLIQYGGKLGAAGNTLKSLHTARTRADYFLGDTIAHSQAETFVEDALFVLSLRGDVEVELRALLPTRISRRP